MIRALTRRMGREWRALRDGDERMRSLRADESRGEERGELTRSLGWRGWWRTVEILTIAFLFAVYLYVDGLAACDPRKVRGRFRRALRWCARRFLTQETLRREERLRAQAAWLRARLVKLGPTFIKIGQALATRADLLPLPYIQELARLQDEVPPFPSSEAARILQEELGAPPEHLFALIHWEPIASASLGQVYHGRLPSGEEVAIKVQRPRLREAIQLDLRILKRIARWLKRYPDLFRGVDWTGVLDEFAATIFEEMDYRQEALHAERFRENFRRWKEVYVPKIYWAYTTERVLTMEYIHGMKVTNVEELRRRGLSPLRVNRFLARTYLKQLLEDGFFHADPHPGNLRVMPDGRLAFFDFGMVGRIDASLRRLMIEAFFHIVNRDVAGLVDDLIRLGFLDPSVDPRLIRPLVEGLFREYLGLKLSEIKFKELTYELAEVVYAYPFKIPSRFTYMIRALMELEGIGITIDPDFNFIEVARPFAREYLFKREARQLRTELLHRWLRGRDGAFQLERLWRLVKLAVRVSLDKLRS